ncbi:MAG TPA: phosphopantetheine-binding protein [Thermoanaerobaculia bacterium]|nr:phosphopantetheine-binding protein [Thermoanaerobaculia bacterium]
MPSNSADAGDHRELTARLKEIIVESLNLEGTSPESIGDAEPLFGDGLGLDSVDALELVVALEKEYGIKIRSDEIDPQAFATVESLAGFVAQCRVSEGSPASGDAAG